jgi:hypothetical protein
MMRRFLTLLGVLSVVVAPSVALAAGNPHGGPPATGNPNGAPPGQTATHAQGNASTSGTFNQPQPLSTADSNSGGANGQCPGGPYCSTRNGAPSLNGNGNGSAVGKPCAGCVGKADNKNPHGQLPNGSDPNNGYECDGNQGIGKTNPAHTGCSASSPTSTSTPPSSSSTQATSANQPPGSRPGTPPGSTPGSVSGVTSTATSPTTAPGATPSSGIPSLRHSAEFASLSTPTTLKSGSLPFTGIDVGAVILAGCMMMGLGMMGLGLVRLRAASHR